MNDVSFNYGKLVRFFFLNMAYLLRESNETIQYGTTQYGDPEKGFSITMLKVDHSAYDYATECFMLLGGDPKRECGPTIASSFESVEDCEDFKSNFMSLLEDANDRLKKMLNLTPQEYSILKTAPTIQKAFSTDSKHYTVLSAMFSDISDMMIWENFLRPWNDTERVRDYSEVDADGDGTAEIIMTCYKLRKQKKFIKYLRGLGIGENY